MNKFSFLACGCLLALLSACSTTAEESAGGVANNAQEMLGVVWNGSEEPTNGEEKEAE